MKQLSLPCGCLLDYFKMMGWRHYLTLCLVFFPSTVLGGIVPRQSPSPSTYRYIENFNYTVDGDARRPSTRPEGDTAGLVASISRIAIQTRENELDEYEKLWRQVEVGPEINSSSKTDVLGYLLKRHVHKLRTVPNEQVELIFLVDSSASVGRDNFFNEIKFVKDLLADFTVAYWAARVAIITFSSSHRVHAVVDQLRNPSTENHKCSLFKEDLPEITYVGGGTYTKGAFLEAQAILKNARPSATKAIFLITDGYSNGGDPRPVAKALQREGAEIFTFGIKNGNVGELRDMSSENLIEHCYILSSFEEFESLARRALHEDLEEGDYVTEEPSKCHSLCEDDDELNGGRDCCHAAALCRCGTQTGLYQCICPAGHYGTGIGDDCKPCPTGTYKPFSTTGGISTCLPCPDQYHKSPPGSDDIHDCQCQEGFRSTHRNTMCERIHCPPLPHPQHGQFFDDICDNAVNSACALLCDKGYEPVGDVIRLCLETGEWTGTELQCVAKTCDPLPAPEHGFVNCSNDLLVAGTTCSTGCKLGYNLVGTSDRHCLSIAQWDGRRASCRPVTCPPFPAVPNGRVVPSDCTQGRVPYTFSCRVRCRKGYTRIGSIRTSCGANSQWEIQGNSQPECVDISLPTLTCPDDIDAEASPNKNYTTVDWDVPLPSDSTGHLPNLKVFPSVYPPWNFPIGTSTVKYTATDRAGNGRSCSFTITVRDNEPPQAICRSPDTVYNSAHYIQPLISVEWITPVFHDNSGQFVNVTASHRSGDMMPLGSTNVEYIAADYFGNEKRCIVMVNVRQSLCEQPRRPTFGSINCVTYMEGGLNCTARCNTGYAFSVDTPTNYLCNTGGLWTPYPVPEMECQDTYYTNRATQTVRFFYKVTNCSLQLVNDVEQDLSTTLYDRIAAYCGKSMSCNVSTVSTLCDENGALQRYLNSRLGSDEEGPRGSHRDIQGQRGVELTSEIFSALDGPVIEILASIDATIENDVGRSHEETHEALIANLRQIPERLQEEVNNGTIDLSPKSTNNSRLVVLPEHINPLCSEGSVLKETGECVTCSNGTYFNEELEQCIHCPFGTYQPLTGKTSCDSCPSGYSTARQGSKSKDDCQALCASGSFSPSGVEQCESCPSGTYQPSVGARECLLCPNGTTTQSIGSSQLEECAAPCQPGTISFSGLEPCLPCPVGSYQPSSREQMCHPCPTYRLTQSTGAVSIEACNVDPSFQQLRSSQSSALTDIPFSFCFSHPCLNGASCQDVLAGFACSCQPGYTGMLCDVDIDDCDPSPCLNGTCTDRLDDFQCECDTGFQGRLCDENIDDCLLNPCQNNGVCLDAVDDFVCECSAGFEGDRCEIEVDECKSSPCMNNGSCINGIDEFSCRCHSNFTGAVCSTDVRECFMNSTIHDCRNVFRNLRCDSLQQDVAEPLCRGRYDYCKSSPCLNNGTCLNDVSGFVCLCKSGLSGPVCETELSQNFTLIWKRPGTIDYSILKGGETFDDLYEVTVAFWMRTSDISNYGTPFSYAVSANDSNALTLTDYKGFVPNINNQSIVTDVTCNDGLWHHIALTWTADGGQWSLYKDGVKEVGGIDISTDKPIPGGGVFVLGQEQDEPGGRFHPVQSFIGEMTQLNVWSAAFTGDEIYNISRSCEVADSKAVIRWPAFLGGTKGNVMTGVPHFCEGCPEPLPYDYGNVTNYKPGVPLNQIGFVCETGYHLEGSDKAECQVSGVWLPDEYVECVRNLCNPPEEVPHSEIKASSYFYQSEIEYVCQRGYSLIGNATRICQANRQWTGQPPRCIRSRCGAVDGISHGEISMVQEDLPFPAVVFICHEGYRIVGNETVICKSNGSWSHIPSCQQISCQVPQHSAPVLLRYSNGTVVGSLRRYQCRDGYILRGSNEIQCNSDGLWSGYIPSCDPIPCNEFPFVANAVQISESIFFGDSFQLVCAEGYYVEGANSLTCEPDGSWGDYLPICAPVICGTTPIVPHSEQVSRNFVFGETFTYVCDKGYTMIGEGTLTCTANGSWYPSPPTCQEVSCDLPPLVPRAEPTFTGTSYRQRVNYICDEGYILKGPRELECSASREWIPLPGVDELLRVPHCKPVSCGAPPTVENSLHVEVWNHTYLEHFTYHCQDGYRLQGSNSVSCTSTGTWYPLPPTCRRISCEEAPSVPYATTEHGGNLFGDIIRYTCQDGYQLNGNNTLICGPFGSWYLEGGGLQPMCNPVSCGTPPVVQNSETNDDVFFYNQTFTYKCMSGYHLVGTPMIKCGTMGNWSEQLPQCLPISCGPPTVVPHAKVYVTGTVLHNTVEYTCNKGYRHAGQRIVSCSENGTWQPAPPVCNPVQCPTPEVTSFLMISGESYTFNESITYYCQKGFRLSGVSSSQCLEDGSWSHTPPTCSPVSCGFPPTIIRGQVETTGVVFGDSANYSCVIGYYLNGTNPLTCSSKGLWSPSPPSCFPVSCGVAPNVDNAFKPNGIKVFGESVGYICNPGYETSDNMTLTCGQLGQWLGGPPVCHPVSCNIPTIANGYITTNDHTYGSLLTYECNLGYYLVSHGTLRCTADRSLSGDLPICHPVECGNPPSINHGEAMFNLTTYEESVLYVCDEGYELIGIDIHHCTATGGWSDRAPVCRPVFCGQPPLLANGQVHGENFHFDQQVNFTCNVGYKLLGHNTSTCASTKMWSNPTPRCTIVSCSQLIPPENSVIGVTELTYGGLVTYGCIPGFMLQGSATRICQADGSWSGNEPNCQPVDCGTPPDLEYASVDFSGVTLYHQAEYHCMEGYRKDLDVILRCTINGSWSAFPAGITCEPITCTVPPALQNGIHSGSSTEYNATVTYTCNPGYNLDGPSTFVCSEKGWVSVNSHNGVPTCQIKVCGSPPALPDGFFVSNSTTYGGKAVMFCDDGFEINGPGSIRCLDSGIWEEVSSFCDPITCSALGVHENGIVHPVKEEYTFMEYVSVGCREGYRLSGTERKYCIRMNTWNGSAPDCTIISCRRPDYPENGEVNFHSTVYASVAEYSCYNGYTLTGSPETMCLADGTWSDDIPLCQPTVCNRPVGIPHGYYLVGTFHANDTLEYFCNTGYTLEGRGTRTCSSNGEWYGPLPRCSPVQCPFLTRPTNGRVLYGSTSYKDKAAFTCNAGYILHGSRLTECRSNGQWSNAIPSCEPNVCDDPPTFPSASIQSVHSSGGSRYSYQTRVTYLCDDGYKMIANDSITCTAQGIWEPNTVDCQLIECPLPLVPEVLSYTFSSLTVNSEMQFRCREGYFLNGSSISRCTEDGQWDQPTPRCKMIKCPEIAKPHHSRMNGHGNIYKDVVKFTCNPGYHLHGDPVINCTISGDWSSPVPECRLMACVKPPDLEFGVPLIEKLYQPNELIMYRCDNGYILQGPKRRRCQKDGSWTGRQPSCVRGHAQTRPAALESPPLCVFPCLNGGVCMGSYQCNCRYGFAGSRCEKALCMPRCIGNAKCSRRNRECRQ